MCWAAYVIVFAASVSTLPSTSIINEQQNNTCSSSYFEYPCRDGGCVSVSSVCNGVAECPDGSDEALCDTNSTSLELHHLAVEPSHRWKRQAGCKKNQFACKNGVDCIRFDGKCDGVKDCPDGSDETFPLCRKIPCPSHLFRCTYGACVDGTAPCNRIQDCVDNSDELLPRCRNETDEVRGIFRCDDGSTIPAYSHCDGIKDCKDGSDETISACAGKICADYVFQCAYGACVDANSDCNGKEECADGSDESDELCNRIGTGTVGPAVPPTPTSTGPCLLPPYPKNGRYVVSGRPNATPGQSFDTVGFNVTCDPGFRVVGKKERLCYYGTWNEETISCVRFCRLVKDPSVDFHCQLKDNNKGTRPCEDFEPDGTVVIPTCKTSDYYFPGVLGYMTCYDGNWDYVARCFAECGLVTPDGTGLIAGPEGKPAKKGELPWHTGIYRRTKDPPEQICGGSLVNTRTVISAAHCFWGKQKQQKQPAALFAVALGKIYRVWNHPGDEESEVQRSDILAIHIPAHFQGSRTNYQHDAAVLQLTEKITYYPHIRPVCVSFDLVFQNRQLIDGRKGKVAGWGLTGANEDASPTLKTVSLPYVSVEECLLQSPPDFRVYITGDKICAGFRNGSAVCHGDSGGGLTFPERDERGLERYYLRGVVSTAPEDGNACNVNWLTTFTLLSRLEDFLKPFLRT